MDNVYVVVNARDLRVIGAYEDHQEAVETVDELNSIGFGEYFMYSVDFYDKEI